MEKCLTCGKSKPGHITKKAVQWLQSLDEEIRPALKAFPPHCKVRGLIPLGVPRPGELGEVVGWAENEEGDQLVLVRGNGEYDAYCKLAWLEVVEYPVWTVQDVLDALEPVN